MRRVLIDATSVTHKMKGVGKYAWQLWDALQSSCPTDGELVSVVFRDWRSDSNSLPCGKLLEIPYASELRLGLQILPQILRQTNANVLIRPADKIGVNYRRKTLTVCHDLNRWIWAQQPSRGALRRMVDTAWELMRIRGMRCSNLVVCNSEFVQRGVVQHFRIAPSKTAIGYCGVDSNLIRCANLSRIRDTKLPECVGQYLITFATGDEREGYEILPQLLASAVANGYPGYLVVAGTKNSEYRRRLEDGFRSFGCDKKIVCLPFLGADDVLQLAALYRHADFYLETSKHEGFGMQLVEAMACGTTCFSSERGALREVGARFPLHLDITDPYSSGLSIANGWKQGLHNRNNCDQISHASGFNWQATRNIVTDFAWGQG